MLEIQWVWLVGVSVALTFGTCTVAKAANSVCLPLSLPQLCIVSYLLCHHLESCLENPRDGRAWWAAVYGVAQSRTWLKRLSGRPFFRRWQWHPSPVLLSGKSHGWRSLEGWSSWGTDGRTQLSDFSFTFHFHALEKEMATHSSVLAWRIPGMGEPGWLPSMGLHRVGHDWSDVAAAAADPSLKYMQILTYLNFITCP